MEADIKAGKYLEHGEYEGNLYGTKIDSILEVVQTGRTCILDVNPQVSCLDSKAVCYILFSVEFFYFLCVGDVGLGLFVLSGWKGDSFPPLPLGDREYYYVYIAS